MGAQVSTGALTGGTMMGTQVTTGGSTAAAQMQAAIVSGGSSAASAMGAASAGGGMGGIGMSIAMMGLSVVLNKSKTKEDTTDEDPAEFQPVASYSQGTANTTGIPAMLHQNEAVIPLTGNRKGPVQLEDGAGGSSSGGNNVTVQMNISSPDADSFRRSTTQVQNTAYRAGQAAARRIG
jgi:hypothetical protein